MTKRFISILLLFFALATFISAQEAEQPLKDAKVGDFVVFKRPGELGVAGSVRHEVITIKDKEVTIRTTVTVLGKQLAFEDNKAPMTAKYDLEGPNRNRNDTNILDSSKGQETLKVNGRNYLCDWRSLRCIVTLLGKEYTVIRKVWISKDAPLYGLVRMEENTSGIVTVWELAQSGRK
jgi:hypothetical protein